MGNFWMLDDYVYILDRFGPYKMGEILYNFFKVISDKEC